MSQLISITVTNRGANLDLLPGGPTLYGFDVDDIVSPIRYSSGLSKSYFTTRTNKGGVQDNHNGSKIDYRASDSLAAIAVQSPLLLLLTVLTRRGVDMSSEQMVFVSSKISEDLVPDVSSGGTKFFYIEDGDVLPVEYIVEETIAEIISQTNATFTNVQDRGVDMPLEPKLNFIGYTVQDNTGLSTDIYNIKDETWTKLNAMKTAGTLPVGAWYRITDRYNYQSGATGIIPNKSLLGDDRGYVYIRAITPTSFSKDVIRIMACPKKYFGSINGITSIGVWNINKSIAATNLTIWGGKVWQNLTGSIGTATNDLQLDVVNWVLIPKTNTSYYDEVQFSANYDFDTDWFNLQRDNSGNVFGINLINTTNIGFNFNTTDVSDWNKVKLLDTFFNNVCGGVWNVELYVKNNNLYGYIRNAYMSDISNNTLATIENIDIGIGYYLLNDNLHYANTYGGIPIDITGLTTLDVTQSIPASLLVYANNFLLSSSNPTESISDFLNVLTYGGENKKYKFNIDRGLEVTFVHGTGINQPRCEGATSEVLNGDNCDWIEFERAGAPGNIFCIREYNASTY